MHPTFDRCKSSLVLWNLPYCPTSALGKAAPVNIQVAIVDPLVLALIYIQSSMTMASVWLLLVLFHAPIVMLERR